MTVNELIERLQGIAEDGYGETEVRTMSQPTWPFEYDIAGVTDPEDLQDDADDEDADDEDADEDGKVGPAGFTPKGGEPCVYICEGRQLGYGTKTAWQVAS